jgi:putative tryptophan/tyrosine transport system substrate-binding protein
MNRRRALIAGVAGHLLAASVLAQRRKVRRVAILSSDTAQDPRVQQIREGLRDLGYVEGQDLLVDFRWADGMPDRTSALAAELLANHPDVVVTLGFAIWAVKRQTTTVPVVVAFSGDLLSTGAVVNLSRPGGNITGLSLMSTDLAAKRLQLLKEAFPGIRAVGALYTHNEVASAPELRETETAAERLGLALRRLDVGSLEELEPAFVAAVREGVEGFVVFAHAFAYQQRARIIQLAARVGRPTMYGWSQFVEAGGLMSYGPNVLASVRRAAVYVDRILQGALPGELPVEQPSVFELVVNLRTAREAGLVFAPSVLARADRAIE